MLALTLAALLAADGGTADAGAPAPTLRLRAVGDMMLGTDFPAGFLPPDDGAHLLDEVKAQLADADFTFANFEGPLCDHGETRKCRKGAAPGSCFAFRTPTRYGKYFQEAGIDVGSTANNHSGDFGEVCRRETESTLDALGIKWSGPPGSIASLEVKGRKIAVVAFHTAPSCNFVNDRAGAQKLIREAKAAHDVVIVSFHGGAEGTGATHVKPGVELFHGENRGDLRAFTHAVIDAGADLVLGHGPHVVRAIELYKGHLIAYSMGNFATYGRFDLSGPLSVGMILEVELGEGGRFVRGKIIATRQEGKGVPKLDEAGKAIAAVRALTAADFPKTGAKIAPDGEVSP